MVEGDMEFQLLEKDTSLMPFNIAAQNKYVPKIERYIRTVKDRVRNCYNNLPYGKMPKLMIEHMVAKAVF